MKDSLMKMLFNAEKAHEIFSQRYNPDDLLHSVELYIKCVITRIIKEKSYEGKNSVTVKTSFRGEHFHNLVVKILRSNGYKVTFQKIEFNKCLMTIQW
jgi:hypothetical protein